MTPSNLTRDGRSRKLRTPLVLVSCVALFPIGCGGERAPEERSLDALVAAERFAVAPAEAGDQPLRLPGEPEARSVRIDDERRPAVLLPEGAWTWRTTVPPGGRLQLGVGAPPRSEEAESGAGPPDQAALLEVHLEVQVTLLSEGEREVLEVARGGRREEGGAAWLDLGADLSRWAGREVTLEIEARRAAGEASGPDAPAGPLAWAPAVVAAGRREGSAERPNVLFVVIDTLRHDHMTSYGYERDTAPEIDAQLALRGTVMEDAYAQAPWTLPSVVSYMTGRYPGELLGDDPASYGLPEGVPSLTEEMAALGYRTAGFIANPALHEGNGMARGFETFHSPQGMKGLELHADSINRRAIPWIRAHRDEPFFLYVHYIDPHDPYWNPDLVDGRSPWFDDPGGISGRWVHGVYTGRLPVEDLERTVEHFTALYDSEIRYVDRAVAELLDAIPPEVLEDTLIVLTSDHGEELHDHGGWKHGHTLYEDQIHVPLIFRWDGRIPAGRRVPGTVRLVDVAPTLLSAAGGPAPGRASASWQGEDLLPVLTGDAPLPRMAAYAEDLQVGPLRAATVADGKKLILYNRTEPFEPQNFLQETIHTLDQARLELVELYDLEADPGEHTNLAPEAATGPMARLEAILYHRLDRTLPGVRVLTDALAPGARLVGELDLESPPEAAIPLFLAEGDSVTVAGTRVRFEITGGAIDKGFRLVGEPGGLVAAALSVDGEALPDGRLRYGEGRPFGGRAVPAGALETATFPAAGSTRSTRRGEGRPAGLRVWSPAGAVSMATESSQETLERLKALGYVE